MTTRFAGSSSIDERRRRRLATDAEVEAADPPGDTIAEATADSPAERDEPERPDFACAWIPGKAWQTWLLFAAAVLLVVGLFEAGRAVDRAPDFYGRELSALLSLESGRLLRTTGSLLLLLAGQLALVIWSARTRSTRDFSGRYDVWVWTAAAWFVFAFAHQTEAHRAWSEVASLVWEPDFWNKTILSWFAPTVAAGGVLWTSARADARRCRSAWTLMTLAPLAWIASGLLALGIGSRWLAPWQDLLVHGTALTGHLAGFGAMLLHARYVTYVCNDPPVKRRSTRRDDAAFSDDLGEADAQEPAEEAQPSESKAAPRKKPTRKRTPARKKPEPESVPQPAEEVVVEDQAAEPEPVTKPAAEPAVVEQEAAPATLPMPDDDEADGPPPEMLRGLSKRQKKRVRREWRERQRELADAA